MNVNDALELIEAGTFLNDRDIVRAIQVVLRGPQRHNVVSAPYCRTPHCTECGASWSDYLEADEVPNEFGDCPVPPPLTDPPEVVARRLEEAVSKRERLMAGAAITQAIYVVSQDELDDAEVLMWWLFAATPEQQILCCLLALGKVEG